MARYITTTAATSIAAQAHGIYIQVNAALTGTITCTVGGATFAVITNPAVGNVFRYGGLYGQGAVVVTSSATCDITVTVLNKGL